MGMLVPLQRTTWSATGARERCACFHVIQSALEFWLVASSSRDTEAGKNYVRPSTLVEFLPFECAQVSYQTALGAVFVEGWIFVILAITGVRIRLIRLVPKSIMLATSAGAALCAPLPPAEARRPPKATACPSNKVDSLRDATGCSGLICMQASGVLDKLSSFAVFLVFSTDSSVCAEAAWSMSMED